MSSSENALEAFLDRYGPNAGPEGPVLFVEEVLGAKPDPWQARVLKAFGKGERQIAVRSSHGVGKGHPVDMTLPTPDGERRWGDLEQGDQVWGPDGKPTEIMGVYERGELPVYRVSFTDGSSVVVDGDHLWEVEEPRAKKVKCRDFRRVVSTEELIEEGWTFPNGKRQGRRFRLPKHEAVEYETQPVPMDPYLFGVWLGDGGPTGRITNVAPSVHEAVESAGGHWNQSPNRAPSGYVPEMRQAITGLDMFGCRSYEKYVPEVYKQNDVWTRRQVLSGLMDTDGTVDKYNTVLFTSTSRELAEDVCWLARSLGGLARIQDTVKKPWYTDEDGNRVNGRDAYNVTLTFEDPSWLFTVSRKKRRASPPQTRYTRRWIDNVEPVGTAEVNCISVAHPSSLYLTNDFILTHNTACAAWAIVYMLLCRFPQKTVATAPTSGQLKGALVPEIKMWMGRLPDIWLGRFTIKAEGIYLTSSPDESFFEARTSRKDSPEALQGVHSDHVLLVADEASGVPEQVYEAAIGSMSSERAQTLLIGNPVRTEGFFFDCFHNLRDMWFTEHVSWADSPRVTDDFEQEMARRYGEDSNAYRVRVLGEFPKSDDDTVISYEMVESARQREIEEDEKADVVWGLDVARFGDDRSVLAERSKRSGKILDVWGSKTLMETAGRVKNRWDNTPVPERPRSILVDVIGMGGGVVDRLREMGLPVRAVNVGESASTKEKFMRARDELWWDAREWFEKKDVCLEPGEDDREDPNEILASELVVPTYEFTSTGKIKTESKDSVKKRIRRSPDAADAFVLTFAEDLSTATFGSAGSSSWDKPIRRGLSTV